MHEPALLLIFFLDHPEPLDFFPRPYPALSIFPGCGEWIAATAVIGKVCLIPARTQRLLRKPRLRTSSMLPSTHFGLDDARLPAGQEPGDGGRAVRQRRTASGSARTEPRVRGARCGGDAYGTPSRRGCAADVTNGRPGLRIARPMGSSSVTCCDYLVTRIDTGARVLFTAVSSQLCCALR